MPQADAWDREYRESKLLTKDNKPQSDVVRFFTFLKKEEKLSVVDSTTLDLGCGTGRNSFYLAERGAHAVGYDISGTAITLARERARDAGLHIRYDVRNMGELLPDANESYDIALDVTSSNSLSEKERAVYLAETYRVLRPRGYFFVKALCKDGDTNAKYLLRHYSGPERDTYILPDVHITERVWSREDFLRTYEQYFTILKLDKKTSYSRMNGRSYKRNFWIAYMQKQ